jgi:uncharacterized protein YbcI
MAEEHSDKLDPADAISGAAAEALAAAGPGAGTRPGDAGEMRQSLSNAMVAMKKQFYGKGPTKAKTYINDNYVFCVLEGGLTRNEETLLEAGHEGVIRQYRLHFEEAVEAATTKAVAEITGREVLTYHSQILFRPTRVFEIFVLDDSPFS